MKSELKKAKVPLDRMIALLNDSAAGRLDRLTCPKCNELTISVWFTNPAEGEFRTWFLCSNCDFHTRAHKSDKPAFFSADRVRDDLEAQDRSIIEKAVFRRPRPF
jgi:hypothetical protein